MISSAPMETRRRARGGRWIIGAALAVGCGEEPSRFVSDVPITLSDLGDSRDAGPDVAVVDVPVDAGFDGGRDAGMDAATDAGGAHDVFVESAVLGCRTNADCPSPELYCNGPGCDAVGFCVPRRAASACAMVDAAAADLVCGCDGMTYGSLCNLQVEGVRLARFGLCPRD